MVFEPTSAHEGPAHRLMNAQMCLAILDASDHVACARFVATSTPITCIVEKWWTAVKPHLPRRDLLVTPRSFVPLDQSWNATRPTSGQR